MDDDSGTTMSPEDNDRGVIRPRVTLARPGEPSVASHNALPPGTRLGEFEILGLIGEGGFGIVYLAHDHVLERRVALKEYLPASLAGRMGGVTVSVFSARQAETFQLGLRSFVNEARLLARFDHPSLVRVFRFWEANGTAYMVMPYYEGVTLCETLERMAKPPSEQWLKQLLNNVLDALSVLHAAQCVHRDIAPDNILILASGRPVLLDFGAARRMISDRTQALTAILKPGYAPIEQYAGALTGNQGPWTDVYALASVAYFAIMGEPPPPSVARLVSDPLVPLERAAAGRYSAAFLKALDRGLAVKPEDRPQDTATMQALFGQEQRAAPAAPADQRPGARPTPAVSGPVPQRRRGAKLFIATAGIVIALAGAVALLMIGNQDEPAPQPEPPLTSKAPDAAPEPAPAPLPGPFDPIRALDEVFEGRNPDHAVSISLEKGQLRIGQDQLRFGVRSAKPGYLYVLMVGTDRSHFFLLFPNSLDQLNRVEPGRDLQLPRPAWQIIAAGPAGTNHFVAIISELPRDFASAGLTPLEPFSEFPLETAERLSRAHSGPQPLFAGRANCPPESACPQGYGAAAFSVEEIPQQ